MNDRLTYYLALAALFVAVIALTRTRLIEESLLPSAVRPRGLVHT